MSTLPLTAQRVAQLALQLGDARIASLHAKWRSEANPADEALRDLAARAAREIEYAESNLAAACYLEAQKTYINWKN